MDSFLKNFILSFLVLMIGTPMSSFAFGVCSGSPCVDSEDVMPRTISGRHLKNNIINSSFVSNNSLTGEDIDTATTIQVESVHATSSVGIGTTEPEAMLDVGTNAVMGSGGDKFNTALTLIKNSDEFGTDSPTLLLKHSGEGNNGFHNPDTDLGILRIEGFDTSLSDLAINSHDNFVVQTNSHVGVGVRSPASPLHVEDDIDHAQRIARFYDPNMGDGEEIYFHIGQLDNHNNTAELSWNRIGDGYGENYLSLGTYGNPETLNINAHALVGIRTTTPTALLHINQYDDQRSLRIEGSGNGSGQAALSIGGEGEVRVDAPGIEAGRFLIDKDGHVGIGTTNPGNYKLAVEGTIGARELKVTVESFADFVFDADYPLRPLEEVESYIQKNKHLPEIPSEKQVLKEGLGVGQMQTKLLQKIEELTLYAISQNKRITELEKKLQERQ